MTIDNKNKGKQGEALACDFLKENGFVIVCQNYWSPLGEIDIVAKKEDCLYFVEVKYRKTEYYGTLRDAITFKKKQNMKNSALYYLNKEKPKRKGFLISFLGVFVSNDQIHYDFIDNIYI